MGNPVSQQALLRMPRYVRMLEQMQTEGMRNVSAPALAGALGLNEVQVRKDLAAVSSVSGRPKAGFGVEELLRDMRAFLGYTRVNGAILVGAGSLGRALLGYKGFEKYGLRIMAAFDGSPAVCGVKQLAGKPVFPMERLKEVCEKLGVRIGVIAVPAEGAQMVCEQLVDAGILAIWNFAPLNLRAPEDILIQNEDMAASLALLSRHLNQRLEEKE